MLSFKTYINEGVNDQAIFKAIFLAGGPGSGKSFIVGRTALPALGFKLINSDVAFEAELKKADLTFSPEDIMSTQGQAAREKAKSLTGKKLKLALDGRNGIVIDGTGKDLTKIMKQAVTLRKMGYDTGMIFVNTDLTTALKRNNERARTLPTSAVKKMWDDVQKNIGAFSTFFGTSFQIVDNSEGSDYNSQVLKAYKKMMVWSQKIPKNIAAKNWIDSQRNKK